MMVRVKQQLGQGFKSTPQPGLRFVQVHLSWPDVWASVVRGQEFRTGLDGLAHFSIVDHNHH